MDVLLVVYMPVLMGEHASLVPVNGQLVGLAKRVLSILGVLKVDNIAVKMAEHVLIAHVNALLGIMIQFVEHFSDAMLVKWGNLLNQ